MMKPPLRSQLLIGWIHLCPLLLTFPLLPFIQSASSSPSASTPSTLSSPSAISAPEYFDLRMSELSSSLRPSLHPPLSSSSLSSPILPSSSSFMSTPPTPSLSSISSMRKSWSPLRAVGNRRGKDEKRSISFNEQAMHQYPANEDDEGRVAKELEKDDESDYNQILEGRRISHSDDGARAGSFGQVATHPNGQGLVGGYFFPDEESKDERSKDERSKDEDSKDEEQRDEREKDGINEGDSNVLVGRDNRNVMRKRQSQTGLQSFPSYGGLLSPGFQRKGFLFPSSSFLPSFRVLSRHSFPSSIISGQEQVLPRSSYKQHEGEKLIKSGGRKRALSFFAHWRPADQVEEQQSLMSKGSILPLISRETSLISPITSRGSTIQSRKPALLRWG